MCRRTLAAVTARVGQRPCSSEPAASTAAQRQHSTLRCAPGTRGASQRCRPDREAPMLQELSCSSCAAHRTSELGTAWRVAAWRRLQCSCGSRGQPPHAQQHVRRRPSTAQLRGARICGYRGVEPPGPICMAQGTSARRQGKGADQTRGTCTWSAREAGSTGPEQSECTQVRAGSCQQVRGPPSRRAQPEARRHV